MVFYEGTGAVATPEVPEGATAAADTINPLGGIDGSPIELVECNLDERPERGHASAATKPCPTAWSRSSAR